jgi:geranylgeranyl pyrophosphate synthase
MTLCYRFVKNVNTNQMWGVVVLLVSKLAGYSTTCLWNENEFDEETGILHSQRTLAENVEILATGNEMHNDGVLNMQHMNNAGINLDNDNSSVFGNKMAILSGDMLLGLAFLQIAKLR